VRTLQALAGETARMARQMVVLDKTEAELDREMEHQESRGTPSSSIGRYVMARGMHVVNTPLIR